MKTPTRKTIKLADFRFAKDGKLDISRNVREQNESSYDLQPLMDDIALRGIITPPVIHRAKDGKFDPIQGFRRVSAAVALGWKEIPADVYEGLDEHEIIGLMLDHGQRRGLSKAELQIAFEKALEANYTEKEVVTMLKGLLVEHYPPSEGQMKKMQSAEDYLNYYRGIVQRAKRAYGSPKPLHDAYMKKLRGEQSWPTDVELREAYDVFRKEADADNTITKDKPGKEYRAHWDKVLKDKQESAGRPRPKPSSMKNRESVLKIKKDTDSVLVKFFCDYILNDIANETWPKIVEIQKAIEEKLTPKQLETLKSLTAK